MSFVHNCIHKCRSLSACFVVAAAKPGPRLSQVLRLTNSNSQDTERERERAAKLNSLKFSLRLTNSLFEDTERQREKREETGLLLSEDRINFLQETLCNHRVLRILVSECLAAGEEENSFPIAYTWVQWVGEVKSFSIAHGWGVWQTPANSVHNWGLRRLPWRLIFIRG